MTSPVEKDISSMEELMGLLDNSDFIPNMSENKLLDCILSNKRKLEVIGMGGRSEALVALTVLLWKGDRSVVYSSEVCIEKLLTISLRIATDPSFIFPEWGVILAGVIIARYFVYYSEEKREALQKQSNLLLDHLSKRDDLTNSVRVAAKTLSSSCVNNFEQGLTPVIKAAMDSWPNTAECYQDTEKLSKQLYQLSKIKLSADLTDNIRRDYKYLLEKKGNWQKMRSIDLK